MRTCPVNGCETIIVSERLVCHRDWMRLPAWARDDLTTLRQTEPDSDLCRETVAVALAYLDDAATRSEVPV